MKNGLRVPAVFIGVLVFFGILVLVFAGTGMVSPWFYVVGSLALAIAGFLGSIPGWSKNSSGGDSVI